MIGVSACLAGENVKYSGGNNLVEQVRQWVDEKKAVMICPEVWGGLSIPRSPCEIIDNKVISNQGRDCTKEYQLGAKKALAYLKKHHVKVVLLKANSPSCGSGVIYDGSFSHQKISGDGIAVRLFKQNGILVYNEDEIDKVKEYIEKE